MKEKRIRAVPRRSYLRWCVVTRRRNGAHLVEPTPIDVNTPEGFYHAEQLFRSTLEQRFIAHGGVLKGRKL